MPSRIVYFADGTWDGAANNTNVSQLKRASLQTVDQVVFYDDGVGATGTLLEKLVEGGTGAGLHDKVREGYTRIAHNYEKENAIFIFGFSRGSYTARSLAGMIACCGLPLQAPSDSMIDDAWSAYRERDMNARQNKINALTQQYNLYDAPITMVGVWDTVGALGIPAIFGGVDPLLDGFLDTSLHPDVKYAYHAVSIDERRGQFPATLWSSKASATVMEQVYFPGVHCDVGGSYPETGLADITLSWMMNKALAIPMPDGKPGILIDDAFRAKYNSIGPEHALDVKHESWKPMWGIPIPRKIASNACIKDTVWTRCQHDPTYRPTNLTLKPDGTPADTYRKAIGASAAAAG